MITVVKLNILEHTIWFSRTNLESLADRTMGNTDLEPYLTTIKNVISAAVELRSGHDPLEVGSGPGLRHGNGPDPISGHHCRNKPGKKKGKYKNRKRGNPWSRGRTSDSQLGDPGSIPARSKIIFLLRGSSVEAICSPGSSPGQIFDL